MTNIVQMHLFSPHKNILEGGFITSTDSEWISVFIISNLFLSIPSQYMLFGLLSQYLLFLHLLISFFSLVTFVEVIIDVWPICEEPYVL